MRNILFVLALSLTALIQAQQLKDSLSSADTSVVVLPYPAILKDMPQVRVVQDSTLTLLMQEKIAGITHGTGEMAGFRVQVFSSNEQGQAKTDALNLQAQLEQAITTPVYVVSDPPSIKVRIGDFRTREEALAFQQEFLKQFPEMTGKVYVVPDEHIKIKTKYILESPKL